MTGCAQACDSCLGDLHERLLSPGGQSPEDGDDDPQPPILEEAKLFHFGAGAVE